MEQSQTKRNARELKWYDIIPEEDVRYYLRLWDDNNSNPLLDILSGQNEQFQKLSTRAKGKFLRSTVNCALQGSIYHPKLAEYLLLFFESIQLPYFLNCCSEYIMKSLFWLTTNNAPKDNVHTILRLCIQNILKYGPNKEKRIHYLLNFLNFERTTYFELLDKFLYPQLFSLNDAISELQHANYNNVKLLASRLRKAIKDCRIALDSINICQSPSLAINVIQEIEAKQPYYQAISSSIEISIESQHRSEEYISREDWINIDNAVFYFIELLENKGTSGKVNILLDSEGKQLKIILSTPELYLLREGIDQFMVSRKIVHEYLHDALTVRFPLQPFSVIQSPYPRLLEAIEEIDDVKQKNINRKLKIIAKREINFNDSLIVDKLSDHALCHYSTMFSEIREMLYRSLENPHQLSHLSKNSFTDPKLFRKTLQQIIQGLPTTTSISQMYLSMKQDYQLLSPRDIIKNVIDKYVINGKYESVSVKITLENDINPMIRGDAQSFMNMFDNLIHNALKSLKKKRIKAGKLSIMRLGIVLNV